MNKCMRTLSVLILAFGSLDCDAPPETGDAALPGDARLVSAEASLLGSASDDVQIGLGACVLVAGVATPVDVMALFGRPFATGGGDGKAGPTHALVYLHHDPATRVPDMVYFMFQQTRFDPEMRLAGAVRTTNAGPGGFTCFRDSRGNLVPPLSLSL
jgi:hypothetical protein